MATRRCGSRGKVWFLGLVALLTSVLNPGVVRAEEGEQADSKQRWTVARGFHSVFDVHVLRPSGIVVLAVGSVMLIPTAILSSPGGRDPVIEAFETFVEVPFDYAFRRPLGEF